MVVQWLTLVGGRKTSYKDRMRGRGLTTDGGSWINVSISRGKGIVSRQFVIIQQRVYISKWWSKQWTWEFKILSQCTHIQHLLGSPGILPFHTMHTCTFFKLTLMSGYVCVCLYNWERVSCCVLLSTVEMV